MLVPVVLAVGLLTVLAAASASPWAVADRFHWWSGAPSYRQPASVPPPPTPASPPPPSGAEISSLVAPVFWALLVLAALAVAFWVWRVLPRPAGKHRAGTGLGAQVPGQPEQPSAPAVQHGVGTARDLLDTVSDPTDAVLAAWVALEQAAERSGVARRPADTPTEFTARVLTATEADAAAVQTLLGLYHRARFSAAGVGPDAVAEARRCLDTLAGSWSRFSAVVATPPDEPRA